MPDTRERHVEPRFDMAENPWILETLTCYITSDANGDDLRPEPVSVRAAQ